MEIKVEQIKPTFNPVTVYFSITDEELINAIYNVYNESVKQEKWASSVLAEMFNEEQNLVDNFIDNLFSAIVKEVK